MGIHKNTPKISAIDPRGLPVRLIDYWRVDEGLPVEPHIQRNALDAAGRVIKQWDPRLWALQLVEPQAPANSTSVYSLSASALRMDSVDAGTQVRLLGPGGEDILDWDSRQTLHEFERDGLLRPLAMFEWSTEQPRRCVERLTYGQPGVGDPSRNQYGQLIRHDDLAGSVLFDGFALGTQVTHSTRHFILDLLTPVDWPKPLAERQELLEPGAGATSLWKFGALGGVLEQIDARHNRQVFGVTVDGRLRDIYLQLNNAPQQMLVSDIRYNAAGSIEHEIAGNNVRTTLDYRAEDGRLMSRSAVDANNRTLQYLIYDYDPTGNVLSIEDKVLPIRYFANQRVEPISRFVYDSLYRLSDATGWEAGGAIQGPESLGRVDRAAVSNYRQTYRYDAGGNLLELTHVGAQSHGRRLKAARYSNRCLAYRNDMPPTDEEISAAFDARGNLLALDQGRWVQWDLRNRLQAITPVERDQASSDQEQYLYDGGGKRVRKVRSLQTRSRTNLSEVRYLPGLELRTDGAIGEILDIVKVQAGLNSVRILHWESSPPSGINDQCRYGLTDHLESTALELAADAQIISREMFYPFGETAWVDGDSAEISYKIVRYSGKERDATGLYDFGYRLYIPWLQRWLNPDPVGGIESANLYCMALNNPVTYTDAEGTLSRKRLANGLWEPVIATGAERMIAGAAQVSLGSPDRGMAALGEPTSLNKALDFRELGEVEVTTKFLDPIPGRYSQSVVRGLSNKAGGAEFIFTMDRLSYSGASKGAFNALRIVDIARGEMPDKDNAVAGYWAPQGGYVDIPLKPSGVAPNHVFTPGFSGCSLTVDQLNDNVLRVRHVEGNKEDAQFNNLSAQEHGMGLSAAMEFFDYGYASNDQGKQEEVTTGFAFMKYDPKQQHWNINYQTTQGASGIERYKPGPAGFFNRSNATVSAYANTRVRKAMSKKVIPATR